MPEVASRASAALRRGATAFALYALLLVLSFAPQSLRPGDTVAYVGDSLESVYIVAWNVHQFFRSPRHLFDANVFYPLPRSLTFTDHRLLPSLLVSPVLGATGNPVLACNVAVGFACLLAAFGARSLARSLGTSPLAAWAAGALYAFHTYQVNEAPRLNVVFHGFLPFALGQLVRYLRTGDRRHAFSTAGLMLLQGLSSNYLLLYGCLLLGLVILGAAAARPRTVLPRLPMLVLAGAVAALLFAPVAWPYVLQSRAHGYVRELPVGVDLEHYVSTSPTNLFYGAIGAEVRVQQQGPHFVGFAALGLALLAVAAWALRRGEDPPEALVRASVWVPAAALLALLFVALSLGRDVMAFGHRLAPGPYRLLYACVPGFQLVRIPERLALLAMLFVALLAARGLTIVSASRLRPLAPALALLVPAEHLSPLPLSETVPVGPGVPAVYRWLAENPVHALVEVPVRGEGLVRRETVDMYFSAYHFKPLAGGYTAYPPLLTRLIRRLAARFPQDVSLRAFEELGIDTVVVHQGRPVGSDLLHQLAEIGKDDPDHVASLLHTAGLDVFGGLLPAVAAGRLQLVARFEGPSARLYESTADEVYRIVSAPRLDPAPFPSGHRVLERGWRYRAKAGDPRLAADADLDTAWTVPRSLRGDEFFEVTFPRPVRVSGLVLPLLRSSAFATRFRIGGLDLQGRWSDVARFDDAHELQLLERVLRGEPPAIGFDLGGRELLGLQILVAEGGTSFEGWSLPEVEVLAP